MWNNNLPVADYLRELGNFYPANNFLSAKGSFTRSAPDIDSFGINDHYPAINSFQLAAQVVEKGMPAALSDATVAAAQARAAATGAYLNVQINLPIVDDEAYVAAVFKESKEILDEVTRAAAKIVDGSIKKLEA